MEGGGESGRGRYVGELRVERGGGRGKRERSGRGGGRGGRGRREE